MTTKTIFSFIIAATFVTVSCKNDLEPQESISEIETVATAEDHTDVVIDEQVNAPQMQTTPAASSQPVQQAPKSTAAGMNPAHGQPGHRCEIPVGAPLNSAPASQTPAKPAPIMTSGQLQNNPAVAPPSILNPSSGTTATGKGGINPAHGQPGHRCDIAVGQPLP